MIARIVVLGLLLASISSLNFTGTTNEMCVCKFVAPLYAPIARTAQIQGTVRLKVTVKADGSPDQINIVEEGHPILRAEAEKAVRQWKFCHLPDLENERELIVTVKFAIGEKSEATNSWAPTDVTFESPGTVEVVAPSSSTVMTSTVGAR